MENITVSIKSQYPVTSEIIKTALESLDHEEIIEVVEIPDQSLFLNQALLFVSMIAEGTTPNPYDIKLAKTFLERSQTRS